jgi:hypothetical protein
MCTAVINEVEINTTNVQAKIKCLKVGKAPGPDGIIPQLLIETADIVSVPLTMLFKASLATGIIPDDWKRANVSALFKKGAKDLPANYRPISLTSQVCKVLESIIKDHIYNHLCKYSIVRQSQHGFIKNRSCLSNLLNYMEYVQNNVDANIPVDVIYLDFQKAFDKVSHKLLGFKLNECGIRGPLLMWIENWLADREQRVVLNGFSSEWLSVDSGVPQGSVLGPILFVIYINDIDQNIDSNLLKFADDTKVYRALVTDDDVSKLQNDLKKLCEWSELWSMNFNVEKCKVLHFGKNNPGIVYEMNHTDLESVDEERDLGILVRKDLKVSSQVNKVVKTANRVLGMIKRSFVYKDKHVLLKLYKSLVRPHVEFCVQAWRPYLKKDIELLEKVQRRFTMMVPGMQSLNYEEKLRQLKLPKLETRRLRGDMIEVFKIFHGYSGVTRNVFQLSDNSLRGHHLKLFKKRFNSTCGKYAFSNRVTDLWNSLPVSVIMCDTVKNFEVHLDRFLTISGRLT